MFSQTPPAWYPLPNASSAGPKLISNTTICNNTQFSIHAHLSIHQQYTQCTNDQNMAFEVQGQAHQLVNERWQLPRLQKNDQKRLEPHKARSCAPLPRTAQKRDLCGGNLNTSPWIYFHPVSSCSSAASSSREYLANYNHVENIIIRELSFLKQELA